MDKFLERYKLPNKTEEKINNINSPASTKKIEFSIKNLPLRTFEVQMTSLVDYSHHLINHKTNPTQTLSENRGTNRHHMKES